MDKSVATAKLADSCVTSAKIAAKSVTREKLADSLFPLVVIAEVKKQYTIGAGSTLNLLVSEIPEKPGYVYAGTVAFNTGNMSCLVSGLSGRYIGIKNTHSQAITATASLTFLYIRH